MALFNNFDQKIIKYPRWVKFGVKYGVCKNIGVGAISYANLFL